MTVRPRPDGGVVVFSPLCVRILAAALTRAPGAKETRRSFLRRCSCVAGGGGTGVHVELGSSVQIAVGGTGVKVAGGFGVTIGSRERTVGAGVLDAIGGRVGVAVLIVVGVGVRGPSRTLRRRAISAWIGADSALDNVGGAVARSGTAGTGESVVAAAAPDAPALSSFVLATSTTAAQPFDSATASRTAFPLPAMAN